MVTEVKNKPIAYLDSGYCSVTDQNGTIEYQLGQSRSEDSLAGVIVHGEQRGIEEIGIEITPGVMNKPGTLNLKIDRNKKIQNNEIASLTFKGTHFSLGRYGESHDTISDIEMSLKDASLSLNAPISFSLQSFPVTEKFSSGITLEVKMLSSERSEEIVCTLFGRQIQNEDSRDGDSAKGIIDVTKVFRD